MSSLGRDAARAPMAHVEGLRLGGLNRLHEKGFITDPEGRAKSVLFTEEGIRESQRLFTKSFLRSGE